jgi:hypothetical protein
MNRYCFLIEKHSENGFWETITSIKGYAQRAEAVKQTMTLNGV